MADQPLTTSAFVVIKGTRTRYGNANPVTGLRPVTSVSVARITQNPPKNLSSDEVVARVTFSVSPSIFDPVIPTAVLELFDGAVERGDIIITAEGD